MVKEGEDLPLGQLDTMLSEQGLKLSRTKSFLNKHIIRELLLFEAFRKLLLRVPFI
jgi:hypothetical protein